VNQRRSLSPQVWGHVRSGVAIILFGVLVPGALFLWTGSDRATHLERSSAAAGLALGSQHQVVFILVTATFCAAANDAELRRQLSKVPELLADHSGNAASVWTVGVAIDSSVQTAASVLDRFGIAFDEVSVGGGWANSAALRYLWSEGGRPSVPQVIIVDRTIRVEEQWIRVEHELIARRVVGADSLRAWITGELDL
jgi:hypothetical protein